MLINFSNHPSDRWSDEQLKAARKKFGNVIDLSFPNVDPTAKNISELGDEYIKKIRNIQPPAVLCQGEFTLAFYVITALKDAGIKVVSATSERNVVEKVEPDGSTKKIVTFKFVQFREF